MERPASAERIGYAHRPLKLFWGARPPAAVTTEECRRYQAERAQAASGPHGKPASASTVRTELQALRAALVWQLKADAPAVPLPERPEPRARWLTREEADRLLAACERPHVRLFVQIGLRTGARMEAILSLTWDRVSLDRRTIDFRLPGARRSKKRRVPVPINDTLLAELRTAFAARTCNHVVEWAGGRVATVKQGIRRSAARAGMPEVTAHVLRHTAATWALHGGASIWDVAGMLGVTPAMVERVYGHHASDHLSRATAALA